ncbi:class I adenylate-forming enzyme family protein [Halobacillus sp. HZG1]|uniref:class I adenylate-forming enzyme family protein n=1 Tax=Halobacillus sp. HZG1 TaxID=3111769 RepID=UPI002DB6A8A6|nr:class I adenylate-forming enzyme family protein [Halobacillus sp. HZG1]MEC3885145.1 class I adenylate-forming enzyme family protein [Halobacillus sp. HZG1]
MDSLIERIGKYAFYYPERIAAIDEMKELTYKELNEKVNQWFRYFEVSGMNSKHPVMIYMNNTVSYIEVLLALIKINANIIPLNTQYKKEDIEFLWNKNPGAFFISDHSVCEDLENSAKINNVTLIAVEKSYRDVKNQTQKEPDSRLEFSSPLIFFTSGTTGIPKGILVQPDSFFLKIHPDYFRDHTEYILVTRPLFFRSHLTLAVSVLQEGKTLVLSESNSNEKTWLLCDKYSINQLISGPLGITSFLDWIEANNKKFPETLETIMTTGSPISYTLKERLMVKAPHSSFIDFYGTSEVGGISFIDESEWLEKHGSVGMPSFFVKCLILDETGKELPTGEVGEICIDSPHTMEGYLNDLENNQTFFGDYIRTGDYGYIDFRGYLYLKGREQDRINHGGFHFYSTEVEDYIIDVPNVKEVVVLGKKCSNYGQRPIAYVVFDASNETKETLINMIKQSIKALPSFKKPVYFHALPTIPLTAAGKPDREKLLSLEENELR